MNNTPISDKTKEGMTLSIDDIKFIKVRFDQQDEWIKTELTGFSTGLKGDLDAILKQLRANSVSVNKMLSDMRIIRSDINTLKSEFNIIKNDVADLHDRIDQVETEVKKIKENLGLQAS